MLTSYQLPLPAGGRPSHAVVFLHGLGDHGQGGLLSLGAMWQPILPTVEFICPDAPFPFDMDLSAPGRQWFSLQEFTPPSMLEGVRVAAPYLDEFIDHVLKTRNLAPQKLALVGFSQGTMMALYVAPRRANQIAGVLGYSGVLIGGDTLPAEKKSSPPVLLVHGTADEVVPYAFLNPSDQGLTKAGIPVTTVTCPGTGHTIDERGLTEGLAFLKKVLV